MINKPLDLSVSLGKMRLKNPVMPASGTFGYGREFADFVNLADLGAIIVKGTTLNPRLGNPPNRFLELAGCCYLTTVGLQNIGIQRLISDKIPYLRQFGTPLIVNIAGSAVEDFIKLAGILTGVEGIQALQVNLACPNTKDGGMAFAANPDTTFAVVNGVRKATDLTVIAKFVASRVPPNTLAKVCEEAGADAVRPGAGLLGMAIDINTRKSKLGKNLLAAVGGPALKPINVRIVWEVVQAVKIPVIGGGGITCAEDALEFIIVGATAIEIGSYNLIDPSVTIKTIQGIKEYMVRNEIRHLGEIRGTLKLK